MHKIIKIFAALALLLALIAGSLAWMGSSAFNNEEKATLTDSIALKKSRVVLALYRQEMWDGTIWRLFEITGTPLSSVPSLNADIKIKGKQIAYKFETTGRDGLGPYRFKRIGDNETQFCSANSCWNIECLSANGECSVN